MVLLLLAWLVGRHSKVDVEVDSHEKWTVVPVEPHRQSYGHHNHSSRQAASAGSNATVVGAASDVVDAVGTCGADGVGAVDAGVVAADVVADVAPLVVHALEVVAVSGGGSVVADSGAGGVAQGGERRAPRGNATGIVCIPSNI